MALDKLPKTISTLSEIHEQKSKKQKRKHQNVGPLMFPKLGEFETGTLKQDNKIVDTQNSRGLKPTN